MSVFKCKSSLGTHLSSVNRTKLSYFWIVFFMIYLSACDDDASTPSTNNDMEILTDQGTAHDMDPNLLADMMVTDVGPSPVNCIGSSTTADCLSIIGETRNWRREWRDLGQDSLNWNSSEVLETKASFNSDLDQQIPSSLLRRTTPNGSQRVVAQHLQVDIPRDSSSVELVIKGLKADRIFQEGYQSWSFAGAMTIPESFVRDEEGHLYIEEALTGDPLHGEHGISINVIAGQVGAEADDGVWLLAHTDPSYTITAFGAEKLNDSDHSMRLTTRIGFEDIPLQTDDYEQTNEVDTIRQELTLITAPTLWLALRAYQEQIQTKLEQLSALSLRSDQSMLTPQRPPRGWYSWNERFEDIETSYIMEHLDLVAEKLSPYGFSLVEIDDGWQQGWGNWQNNEAFPNDFEPIVSHARQLDLDLGIWFAPFLVEVEVAEENNYPNEWFIYESGDELPSEPDDLVKNTSATPGSDSEEALLVHRIIGNPRSYFVIDTTHPDAMSHVLEQLAYKLSQGFSYFKLDFLYAAALPGKRMEAVSGIESLRKGLAAIREVLGSEAIINACGAPVHAVLGYADSLRIGADTTFGDLYPSFIASAARSTAARAYLFPLIWPDGDQVQTRSPYLTQEAEVGSDVAMLASAAYSIGDDLTQLPQERLNIFIQENRLWWSNLPQPAIPINIMEVPALSWIGNPLIDHLQNNGETGALPPNRFLGQNSLGELRLLTFDWSSPYSSQEQVVNVTFANED